MDATLRYATFISAKKAAMIEELARREQDLGFEPVGGLTE